VKRNYLRVGSLCKPKNKSFWKNPNQVLRVAKREKLHSWGEGSYRYFVVGLGGEAGFGSWFNEESLRPLSALEQLAVQVMD